MACYRCGGSGVEMVCINDMCRGSGECLYESNGDVAKPGCYRICASCHGEEDADEGECEDDEGY
jgi:hypothetical protein